MVNDQHDKGHGPPEIPFTIDGEPFVTDDRDQLAGALLENFAHLDPVNYDLGELHGHDPNPRVYADGEVVHLHPGAKFVALRTGPGPVE